MSFPTLYEKMETNFSHLGLGVLKDTISCIVTEERNGIFELEMEYPMSGTLFECLENDQLIKVDAGHDLKDQLFRIKRMIKNGDGVATIYAQHVSYLTQDLTLKPEVSLRGTGQQVLQQWRASIIDENPFTVYSDVNLERATTLNIQEVENARRALGGTPSSILDIWGGEYKFDNYQISLLENRGRNANTLISYGRNLTDIQQEENIANTYTSIYPFAMYQEASDIEDQTEEILVTVPGFIVDSKHVDAYPNRRILPVDFSQAFENEEIPTSGKLLELAREYIEVHQIGIPQVSMTVSFIDLTKALDFQGGPQEAINICDVIPIYFEKLGIRARAKVIRTTWNALLSRYETLEIGEPRMTLSDKIRDIENDISTIENRPPVIGGENIANVTPRPVTNLKAVGGYGAIHLFWDNQGLTVNHFELYRSMVSDFTPDENNRIYRGRGNGFSDIVETNRQYFYRCRAINYHGVAGEWSHEVMAQTAQIPFDDLEQEVKDGIENAINDANSAMQEAEEARGVAQGAFDHAQNALENSNNALDNSTKAFDTAQGAFDSAQNALEGSKGAQEIADNARTEAKQARQDAETALVKSDNALVRIESVEGDVTQITADVKGVGVAVGNLEGDITNLQVTASGLQTSISNVDGRVTSLSATVNGVRTTVTDLSGNVASLEQASDRLTTRISDTEDNVSQLQQTSNSLTTRITNAEDDISTVTQLATGLQTRVEDAEENISTVTQLATGLQSKVEGAEGNISILQQTSNSLATRITNAENDISTVTQLATGLQTTVTGPNGLQSQVTQLNNQFSITVRRIDGLETDTRSQFAVLENAINLRVQSGDVINQINISDESILIQGNKIHLTGQTRIDNGIITNANIANATITSAKIASLNADLITAGTLRGILISGVNINGSVITSEASGSIVTMTQGQVTMTYGNTSTTQQGQAWLNPDGLVFRPSRIDGSAVSNVEVLYRPEGMYRRPVGGNFTHYINMRQSDAIRFYGDCMFNDGINLNNQRIRNVMRMGILTAGVDGGIWFPGTTQAWKITEMNNNMVAQAGNLHIVNRGRKRITFVDNVSRMLLWRNQADQNQTRQDAIAHDGNAILVHGGNNWSSLRIGVMPTGRINVTTNTSTEVFRPVRASAFEVRSTLKSKENIKSVSSNQALELINSLKVKTFHYKTADPTYVSYVSRTFSTPDNYEPEQCVGVISEESPAGIVCEDGESVNTTNVLFYNVSATQQLYQMYMDLNKEYKNLKQQLTEMERCINE